ncbi:Piwi domain-containing protein [Suillus subluteus]|nr:Piwi domain-containing protein [Suillus subluteus]
MLGIFLDLAVRKHVLHCKVYQHHILDYLLFFCSYTLPEDLFGARLIVTHDLLYSFAVSIAIQCWSQKCFCTKPQYYANVCLKVNVKLGGIIFNPQLVIMLTDPCNPTIVMGANVTHPAFGSDGCPSFTTLVGNLDSNTAKYIAISHIQVSHVEIIENLQDMVKYCQFAEKKTGNLAPVHLIFYRDGVFEGQFKQVLDSKLKSIKGMLMFSEGQKHDLLTYPDTCAELKINPRITIIIGLANKIKAGTVVDQGIAHPMEFDWYLQSRLLGTSCPAHYNILYDENNFSSYAFSADGLQSLSFTLCHVYAWSTRSVSIPTPVYYVDIVCSHTKNQYNPQGNVDFSDSATQLNSAQAEGTLEAHKHGFKPLHANMQNLMYFS